MAIPAIPQNFTAQQANGAVSLTWNAQTGATSYNLQRSLDGVTYTDLATPATNLYLDTTVTLGVEYWYQVASVNVSGTSGYSLPDTAIPSPTGELSLGELRERTRQKADRVNSNFVTDAELNFYINQSMFELYDLLITAYEDYFMAPRATFTFTGQTDTYPLPNGVLSFINDQGSSFVAQPLYKMLGLDLSLNTAQNAYITIHKFNFIDRNQFVYPNTASTLYGVFNMRYRMMGTNIQFMPTPSSAGQSVRLNYIPRLKELLQDTDITTIGFSGWLQYVIVRAAKYALDKEESDTASLTEEIGYLKQRIEESSINRDSGQPDSISDIRQGTWSNGGSGWGVNGPSGGY